MRRLAFAIATMLVGSAVLAEEPSGQMSAQPSSRSESPHALVMSKSSEDFRADSAAQSSSGDTNNKSDANKSDVKFLKDFARFNAAEVDTGNLAKWKAKDSEVKAFAMHMLDTHSQTLAKIQTIAAQNNVDVKAKPSFMQNAKAIAVDMSVGASFDRAYMKAMVKEHEKTIDMLEEEIKNGQDANIKQFASGALAAVQKHLKMAQDLRAKVFADPSESASLARNDAKKTEKLAANR